LKPGTLNQEFSIEEFKIAFPPETLMNVKKIIFCGDIGDPIYATDFLEIVEYAKQFFIQLFIVTNGSYKKESWWLKLASLLNHEDTVQFSVDGWDNVSNNIYRVNSDYDSIIAGIKTLRKNSNCIIKWSTIYFNFNENRMDDIKQLAKSLGVDVLQTVSSTKFDGRYSIDGQDPLKPKNEQHHNSSKVYLQTTAKLSDRQIPIRFNYTVDRHEWARCMNWKKELFINVEGLVFPCPWFNSGYQSNDFVQKYKDQLNVKTRSLNEILADSLWGEFMLRLQVMPLDVCKIKCKDDR
jgi:MoaA/NifB/PqqE/SkfB family radical SAM enzyme